MSRLDLYSSVHKGIRAALFEAALQVGRTDFAAPEESAAAARGIRRLLGFLDEHAEHEDAVILPELARIAPELHADLVAEHARVEGLGRELGALAARLEGATEPERASLGRRIHSRLARLVAEHLAHMDREETEANRALWAHRSDAELAALEERIVGPVPPARMAEWLELMLPAMSGTERGEMLAGMRAGMPPALFDEMTAPARRALGEQAWERAGAGAGV